MQILSVVTFLTADYQGLLLELPKLLKSMLELPQILDKVGRVTVAVARCERLENCHLPAEEFVRKMVVARRPGDADL